MATNAKSAWSTLIQLSNEASPAVWTNIAEVTAISDFGIDNDMIDGTSMDSSSSTKEKIKGLSESAEFGVDVNFNPSDTSHLAFLTNIESRTAADEVRPWRIVMSDWGDTSFTATVNTGTEVWTTASAHGWTTGTPVVFTNAGGALPVSTPQITTQGVYFIARTDTDKFTVHQTNAAAVAGTGAIDFTGAGTGTHTVKTGSIFSFNAINKGCKVTAPHDGKITGHFTFAPTGIITLPS